MPVIKQYKCDGCGAEKREANHWWALSVVAGVLYLQTFDQRMQSLIHLPPRQRELVEDGAEILCGQECVTKKISEFMGAKR